MKNSRGFTLVEIIAVLVLISLLMIFAIPAITGVLSSSRNTIDGLNKKNLTEAGKMFAEDIYLCRGEVPEEVKAATGSVPVTCSELRDKLSSSTGISITVEKLKLGEYFTDNANNCSGTLIIKEINDKFEVDLTGVTCKK